MNIDFFCTGRAFPPKIINMNSKFNAILACLFLASCGEQTTAPSGHTGKIDVEIPVTSEILLPKKGVAYAFVPNNAAQWLSQIVILSEDGDIYQAPADARKAIPIKGAKAKSILGLNRPGAPGMFLALSNNGTVSAYIEINDDGHFGPAPFSSPGVKLKDFCNQPDTPVGSFLALTRDDTVVRLTVTPPDTSATEILQLQMSEPLEDMTCDMEAVLPSPSGSFTLSQHKDNAGIQVATESEPLKNVEITNGITIPGVETPQSVYAVSDNFGGPFNNGLVLVSDADAPRFIIISADFARKQLIH